MYNLIAFHARAGMRQKKKDRRTSVQTRHAYGCFVSRMRLIKVGEKHQRTDIKVQYSQGRARAFIARAEDLPLYQPNERDRGEALPTKHLSSISTHSSTQRAGLPELTDTLSTPSH